jgi:hypothetical protein
MDLSNDYPLPVANLYKSSTDVPPLNHCYNLLSASEIAGHTMIWQKFQATNKLDCTSMLNCWWLTTDNQARQMEESWVQATFWSWYHYNIIHAMMLSTVK